MAVGNVDMHGATHLGKDILEAGASVDTAIAKIEARRVPPQPTMVRG
ncbi:MAG: hypothetical protein KC657_15455 [Myxococcales bacterium]|nr:hypothetical protein [Myxococcales bacterium]